MNSVAGILRSHQARMLLSGASWSVLGQVVLALSQWAVVVLLARLATVASMGVFALGMAMTAPIFGFCNMCLTQLQVTDVGEDYTFGTYTAVRLLSTGIALATLLLIPLISPTTTAVLTVVAVCGVARAADSISDICYGAMQRQRRFDLIGRSMSARGLMCIAFTLLALRVTPTALSAAIALAVAWILSACLIDLTATKRLLRDTNRASQWKIRVDWMALKAICREGLPLSVVTALNLVAINLPRYWVEAQLGSTQLGYFVAVAYLMIAANMVVAAASQVVVPDLAQAYRNAPRKYCRMIIYLIAAANVLGLLCLVLAIIAGPKLMALIYSAQYANLQAPLLWTMGGTWVLMLVAVTGVAMTAARRFRVQVWNSFAAALATAIACACLIKPMGVTGAAIAVLVGMFVKLTGQCMVLAKLMPEAWRTGDAVQI